MINPVRLRIVYLRRQGLIRDIHMRTRNDRLALLRPLSAVIWLAIVWLCFPAMAADASLPLLTASNLRMAGDAARMRVVIEFDRDPAVKWFLLKGPHRLALDIDESRFGIDPSQTAARGLITEVRYGALSSGRSRIIFAANGPFRVEKAEAMKNETAPGYRLVVDMVAAPEAEFDAKMAEIASVTGSTKAAAKGDRLGEGAQGDGRFTIVIDPGHGGIDGGARGVSGTAEKSVTLAFALELKKLLSETGLYTVYLTREKDEFLALDERVRIARQHNADLFVSLHADSIKLHNIRGATIYTISEEASDGVAAEIAESENKADEIAGLAPDMQAPEVADILIDLLRRETQGLSVRFARSLAGELTGSVELINNPLRSAGFRVLRAPDVPSVLMELGYLSNPKDELLLKDPEWRARVAKGLAGSISLYVKSKDMAGG